MRWMKGFESITWPRKPIAEMMLCVTLGPSIKAANAVQSTTPQRSERGYNTCDRMLRWAGSRICLSRPHACHDGTQILGDRAYVARAADVRTRHRHPSNPEILRESRCHKAWGARQSSYRRSARAQSRLGRGARLRQGVLAQ